MTPLRVLVSVGLDDRAFPELVDAVDRWASARPHVHLVAHHGRGPVPRHAHQTLWTAPGDVLSDQMAAATVVVGDGSPSLVREAHRRGHVPVLLPRRGGWRRLGRGSPQRAFVDHLARLDLALVAHHPDELHDLLDLAAADPTRTEPSATARARVRSTAHRTERLLDDLLIQRT